MDEFKRSRNIVIQTISEPWLLMNYGSFFQHYALRFFLKQHGFNVVRRPDTTILKELIRWIIPIPYTKELLRYYFKRRNVRPEWPVDGTLRIRYKFLKEYRRLIGLLLEHEPQDVFAYIAGGDCIWYAIAPYAYFLDKKSNPAARRIAYAASSDWVNVSKSHDWTGYIKQAGESFHGVGLREVLGVEICQKLMVSQKVVQVVDPVFLLDYEHYLGIAASSMGFKSPTLLHYAVNSRGVALNLANVETAAEMLKMSCKVVGIQGSEYDVPCDKLLHIAPTEFLSCLRDAEAVVTNSFHGIVFCLIFRKQFVFINQHSSEGTNVNQRQTEIMTRLNLQSWILPMSASAYDIVSQLKHEIDFDRVEKLLQTEIVFSKKWLIDQLN